MKDILTAITELREQRNWTEYQLAERSGLPQSTISSWFRKGMIPTVPSLEKVLWKRKNQRNQGKKRPDVGILKK